MILAALSLLAALIARLPAAVRPRLGALLGAVAGSILRIRRSHVEAAMLRAGVGDPAGSARAMYRGLGLGLVELLWLAAAPAVRREEAVDGIAIDGEALAALDAACARGPVVLLASHTGNWELAAAAAARHLRARGRRLAVVAKGMHAPGVDTFLARLRAQLGVDVLAPRGAFSAAQSVLGRGDVVVMPIDQVPGRSTHGVTASFLGEPAVTDRAPATLAWRSRATALVVAAERAGGEHRVRVLDVIDAPPVDASARAWVEATTVRATSALEAFVLRSPASWMWLHRRWRAPLERGAGEVVRGRSHTAGPVARTPV